MDISTQIVPAVILLSANLLSGKHGSFRWKTVTAIFGWTAIISLILFFVLTIFGHGSILKDYILQIFGFCLLTALSRDYERILHPIFPWNW
jgi:lysylphosphatidylglycerol synthetase-like protein (DUF2156 family)